MHGIGVRATPTAALADMTVIAGWLAPTGGHLTIGGVASARRAAPEPDPQPKLFGECQATANDTLGSSRPP